MTDAEKILKSMAMAGVEWEIGDSGPGVRNPESGIRIPNPEFRAPKPAAPVSADGIMEIAARRAAGPDIITAIKGFAEHPLFAGAKNTVVPFAVRAGARLLVVTDMPSLVDDVCGNILSGAEGDLFDKMIGAIGLVRGDIAITPLVFWRPAGGRTPTADELRFCRPFVDRVIAETAAERILTLGALAAKEIAGAALPRDHGKLFGNVIPIYKPDFIMRNPGVKQDVWKALKLIAN